MERFGGCECFAGTIESYQESPTRRLTWNVLATDNVLFGVWFEERRCLL